MADMNVVKISPQVAIERANKMKSLATEVEEILKSARSKMEEINDESTGTYFGTKKAGDLRSQLDAEISQFFRFHEQINNFADNIIEVANRKMAE